jgi:hypothetical protein
VQHHCFHRVQQVRAVAALHERAVSCRSVAVVAWLVIWLGE